MRGIIKKMSLNLSKPIPFNWLVRLTDQKFIFPFYHAVSDTPGPHIRHLYPVPSINQFRHDLDFLLKNFMPATFDEVLKFSQSGELPAKPKFFLSFDDGLRECIDIIAPILNEKGIQAAFFINPFFTRNSELSHRQKISLIVDALLSSGKSNNMVETMNLMGIGYNDIRKVVKHVKRLEFKDIQVIDSTLKTMGIDVSRILDQKPYMGINEINALKLQGHIIGSHSMDHREFYSTSEDEMKNQVVQSFKFIENYIEEKRRIFAFPFTDDGVAVSFFRFLTEMDVDLSFGTAGLKKEKIPGHIQRIPMETGLYVGARRILRGEYSYFIAKSFLGKNTIIRK